jgi:superfamily II DNA or RNA helicase
MIVQEWLKHAKDRQTIAFTVDIAHADALALAFKKYGVAAESVWGDDPYRAEKLAYHKNGHLRVLCNCAVLTEGYDDPNVACIIMARPTKSNLLFVQMAGRGTRIQPNIQNLIEAKANGVPVVKDDCLLMDVVDNTSRHSLVTLSSIFGLGNTLDLKGAKVTQAIDKIAEEQKKNSLSSIFHSLTTIRNSTPSLRRSIYLKSSIRRRSLTIL